MHITHIEELEAAGIPMGSHESDLYVQNTPEALEILIRHGYTAKPFINQAPPHQGEAWLDVAFAYLPWWEARAKLHP